MILFDDDKIRKFSEDYSIFHATAEQTVFLTKFIEYVNGFLDLDFEMLNRLFMRVIIDWQVENQSFYSQRISMNSQERLVNTMELLERGKKFFSGLLSSKSEPVELDNIFYNVMNYYIEEIAKHRGN